MFRQLTISIPSAMNTLLAALLLLSSFSAVAIDEVFSTEAGAIGGYDAVAYHTEQRPVVGLAHISYEWNGALWRFASIGNRELFVADPQRFAPAFGGFCAYGTSRGYKVSTEPEAFAIVDGRLFLNYNRAVQATWNKDRPGYIRKADQEWPALEHTAYTRGDR